LAERYDLGQSKEALIRASYSVLLHHRPPWALASSVPSDWVQWKERRTGIKRHSSLIVRASPGSTDVLTKHATSIPRKLDSYANAKIASGVSSLICAVIDPQTRKDSRLIRAAERFIEIIMLGLRMKNSSDLKSFGS